MKPEQVALLVLAIVLIVWAIAGITGIIDGAIEGWREVKQSKEKHRLLFRKNANLLICEIAREDNPITCLLLRTALAATLDEYRRY